MIESIIALEDYRCLYRTVNVYRASTGTRFGEEIYVVPFKFIRITLILKQMKVSDKGGMLRSSRFDEP